MAVYTRVFKVDASLAVGANDDLELVSVPLSRNQGVWANRGKGVRRTLSYHRLVHVPTCTPRSSLYPPQRKFPHKDARSSGSASSRQTTNSADSTTAKLDALFLFDWISWVRSLDHTLRDSVVRMPRALAATSCCWVLSASLTMASRLLNSSCELSKGRFFESKQSNQSGVRMMAASRWR